jgi:nicotinate-nucleotide pyrophosphorylase (carboxylating)
MNYLKVKEYRRLLENALKEDVGQRDITTEFISPKDKIVKAVLLAKENCVVCGLPIAEGAFKLTDFKVKFQPLVKEGQWIKKGRVIARIKGKAIGLLVGERTALNFLSLLSGIATKTRRFVDAVKPFKAKIMDTRKTIPNLRNLEKYAVRVGGGYNHRFRLDEMALIKDNHLKVCELSKIIENIRKKIPKGTKIEVEVKNLKEFKEVLKGQPDIIMLDNMKVADIKKAVAIKRSMRYSLRRTPLEASGGITLKNVKKIASTGVDMISVGALTHSVSSIDLSLEIL